MSTTLTPKPSATGSPLRDAVAHASAAQQKLGTFASQSAFTSTLRDAPDHAAECLDQIETAVEALAAIVHERLDHDEPRRLRAALAEAQAQVERITARLDAIDRRAPRIDDRQRDAGQQRVKRAEARRLREERLLAVDRALDALAKLAPEPRARV